MVEVVRPHNACHKMVAEVAKGMAEAFVEELLRDNSRYAVFKKMCLDLESKQAATHTLIRKVWPLFIEQARSTLAEMLNSPTHVHLHESIADALTLDNSLRYHHPAPKDPH